MNIFQRIEAAIGRFNKKAEPTATATSAEQPAASGTAVDGTIGTTMVSDEVEQQTGEEEEQPE